MDIQAKNDGPTSKSEVADIPQKPLNIIKVVLVISNVHMAIPGCNSLTLI